MAASAFVTGGSGFVGGALLERLRQEGWKVRALARSERAAERVAASGAQPVGGDISDSEAVRRGAEGCEYAFHAAAKLGEWGPWEEFRTINVEGTQRVLEACREAGVRRFVHVGTEAALVAGQPLVMADEAAPLRPDSRAPYCASKAMAERTVREFAGMETVVVRPRLVWGPGDTTILPGVVEAVRAGRFAWVGGGRYRTSTTHVANAVEGLLLGAERGRAGEAYFVTDGEPVEFRDFMTRLLATQGVEPPTRALPLPVARAAAAGSEAVWRLLRREDPPPLSRARVWLSAQEMTIDISKARSELGYEPVISIDEGLAQLAANGA